ncbi:MAG: hypothetical protein ACR2NZ_00240 [Rubripirellula sp.]
MSVMPIVRFLLLLGCCASIAASAKGVDRVWIQPPRPTSTESDWYPRSIEVREGRVILFDGKQLRVICTGDEAETVIASGRVIWIEPDPVSDLEQEAVDLFEQGEHAASLLRLPDILKQRPPVWRQQRITMLSAVNAWLSGRASIALELVGQLDRRPLPLAVVAWLPIAWENGALSTETLEAAKNRLEDPSPAVRLVAASWLLSASDRNQAITTLKSLEQHPRVEIARLAEVLLWRITAPPQVADLATQWQARLDALPMALQTGPTKTVINKLRAAGQSERADQLKWSLEVTPIQPSFDRPRSSK